MSLFVQAFLPLFVAMNLPGVLPLFIGLTDGLAPAEKRRLAFQAGVTAVVVMLAVLFAGHHIFDTLGITADDLRVGGGLILLTLSITDIVFGGLRRASGADAGPEGEEGSGSSSSLGVVPIGIPLVAGPATITTLLVLEQSAQTGHTLAALFANIALVVAAFVGAPALLGYVGEEATKAVAKIASLFLAAIAVAMIRAGLQGMIG